MDLSIPVPSCSFFACSQRTGETRRERRRDGETERLHRVPSLAPKINFGGKKLSTGMEAPSQRVGGLLRAVVLAVGWVLTRWAIFCL